MNNELLHNDIITIEMMSVGQYLKKIRNNSGLSSYSLAEKIGVTQSHISNLENNKRKMTHEWAERLAPHLGVSPDEILLGRPLEAINSNILPVIQVPIYGTVAHNVWVGYGLPSVKEFIPVPDDFEEIYADLEKFAYRVGDESMALAKAMPQEVLVCIEAKGNAIPFRPSDLVIVERRRDDLVEISCKLYKQTPTGFSLETAPTEGEKAFYNEETPNLKIKGIVVSKMMKMRV